MKNQKSKAFAPASVANVAVGFDFLGFSVPILGDTVTLQRIETDQSIVISSIEGVVTDLPYDIMNNTASYALFRLKEDLDLNFGFELSIKKGIPLGSGLGGSAASAVAAVVAANALLDSPLSKYELLKYAIYGESVTSKNIHVDNVCASLFGGLNLCVSLSEDVSINNTFDQLKIIKLPTPQVYCILIHPKIVIETKTAREILSKEIKMEKFIKQSMYLSSFIASCYTNDVSLMKSSLKDIIIEPQRSRLIPEFYKIKEIAIKNGALGCSLSGSGPTIFALSSSKADAVTIKGAIEAIKNELPYEIETWITEIDNKGAYLL